MLSLHFADSITSRRLNCNCEIFTSDMIGRNNLNIRRASKNTQARQMSADFLCSKSST